jgi:hypothetical protein
VFFVDKEHEHNYQRLMEKYGLNSGDDIQYEASIYIAAHPEIFNENMFNFSISPLYAHIKWDEELGRDIIGYPELTDSTRKMVEVGLSLYNGYRFKIDLDGVFGGIDSDELLDVIFQAMNIRARRLSKV